MKYRCPELCPRGVQESLNSVYQPEVLRPSAGVYASGAIFAQKRLGVASPSLIVTIDAVGRPSMRIRLSLLKGLAHATSNLLGSFNAHQRHL